MSLIWLIFSFFFFWWAFSIIKTCAKYRSGKLENSGYQSLAVGRQFTVQNHDQLYVLVSSAHKTTHRDMTCTVLRVTSNPNK